MKRLTTSILVSIAAAALPVALALGQSSIPPVYDATGAMLTAIAPQPTANPRAYPWVYDATGAMQASVAPQPERLGVAPVLPADRVAASWAARLEAQADAAMLAEINRTYGHVDLPATQDTLTSASLSERLEANRDVTGQDAIPPLYDATGAMLIALEPGPLEGDMAGAETQASLIDNGLIDPIERAYSERAVSNAPTAQGDVVVTAAPDAATLGITGYVRAHEDLSVEPVIPPVYDATGAEQAAVVQSSEADAAVVTSPTTAAPRADPSIYLVMGVGLLAAAALVGARMLTHRPATRQHGPRHV